MEHLYIVPVLLFSIVIHELAHGVMALRLGDPTARDLGRLTLNPIPHIDPIGSIVVPLISFMTAGTVFIAWAKPVPINPMNFSNFRRDDIMVSAVGPASNLVLAFFCALGFGLLSAIAGPYNPAPATATEQVTAFVFKMLWVGIPLNIWLAVFNLIPIPPLDGSHVLASLLPEEMGNHYRRIGFFGIFILLIVIRYEPVAQTLAVIREVLMVPYLLIIDLLV